MVVYCGFAFVRFDYWGLTWCLGLVVVLDYGRFGDWIRGCLFWI